MRLSASIKSQENMLATLRKSNSSVLSSRNRSSSRPTRSSATISKSASYPKKYAVQNLWRVELTDYWRMLYTIKGDHVEIVCFVLEIIDHQTYDKRFGYSKK
jgi:hypothetical protein